VRPSPFQQLLSEEVFDFSRGEMTSTKTKELKESLNREFAAIHELCLFALEHSSKADLTRATLSTLQVFLSWVPLGYIFESTLLDVLLRLFPAPAFRTLALQCLTEIGGLSVGPTYDTHFVRLYMTLMTHLQSILPPGVNIPAAHANGSDDEQAFVANLALFLTSFFRAHISLLETSAEGQAALMAGLEVLLQCSYVEDTEVFKVCLDYWNVLVCDLFQSECASEPSIMAAAAAALGQPVPLEFGASGSAPPGQPPFAFGAPQPFGAPSAGPMAPPPLTPPRLGGQRKAVYAGALSKLRLLMICRMAKPEEVIIVEDENGNIVRETMKDNDVLAQYKVMRETLIYLAHLDHDDTERQMLEKLGNQLNGREYGWQALNTLCWAVGSISGSMGEEQENKFLVTVIRDLLNLCEQTRGKDHKAVIASNIMYVVGQYPRFLRAHWKFLKTVVNKLFEFMHETHPGVQDMACDTFLKICQKCKRKFVVQQLHEQEPFVSELLRGLPETIKLLEPHQVHSFYESVGHMISAETDPAKRDEYTLRLMQLPNTTWRQLMASAAANRETLKSADAIRGVANILQTNTSACSSLGQPFATQVALIYNDVLLVYRLYSEFTSELIATGGPYASRSSQVKALRSVKREALRFIETFVEHCEDVQLVATQLVPPALDPILGDYARHVPDARDPEVLSLFGAIINKCGPQLMPDVPRIFEAVFECTLQMITRDFESYPEHRLRFFGFLRAVATKCFLALFALPQNHLQLVMDSIVWAFRHTERNVAETGLALLMDLLQSFAQSEHCDAFFQRYYLSITQEVFAVMTDTFHKPGLKMHALILQLLFSLVEPDTGAPLPPAGTLGVPSGLVALRSPLWDVASVGPGAYPSNGAFVRHHVTQLLSQSFPNMAPAQVAAAVNGMFDTKRDFTLFKNHLRDFLVQTKSFSTGDNRELYAEEQAAAERARKAAVPGMLGQYELGADMDG